MLALTTLTCAAACVEEERYAIMRQDVKMHADEKPTAFTEEKDPIFIVERRFSFQITPPSQAELQHLAQGAQGRKLPFPRLPWIERQDEEIQVDYALENRGKAAISVMVFLDGINEFDRYTPGPEDFHQWEHRYELQPGERISDTITELEMDEVAIDLATVVNGAPNSNQVVQFQSQSGRDPRVKKYVPKVVPGLVGFEMGLQTGAAAELRLTLSARVQDHGGRIAERGEKIWQLPTPTDFVPVVPKEDQ
jgi:hypothetical protein